MCLLTPSERYQISLRLVFSPIVSATMLWRNISEWAHRLNPSGELSVSFLLKSTNGNSQRPTLPIGYGAVIAHFSGPIIRKQKQFIFLR